MITRSGDVIQVSGHVTMANASALFNESLKSAAGSNVLIDLSQLEKVDSSAVSLMLVWLREARRNQFNLRFANVPDNLASLAELYGVAELLAPHTAQ